VGTSGTIRATGRLLRLLGVTEGEITRPGLDLLRDRLLAAGSVERHDLPGLSAQRAPVYPGGLAVLTEVFEALGIEVMQPAEGALREGLLWDLVGSLTDEDARDRSVRGFQQRFHVELAQAERVEATALDLLGRLAGSWSLQDPECADLLSWAARLHEVGLDIAHAQHQLHAAYLLRNADLAGFSVDQQRRLAALVGAHRRKIRRPSCSNALQEPWAKRMPYLLAILRLAVLLHRSRKADAAAGVGGLRDTAQVAPDVSGWLARVAPADPGGPRAGSALPRRSLFETQLSLSGCASAASRASWAEMGTAVSRRWSRCQRPSGCICQACRCRASSSSRSAASRRFRRARVTGNRTSTRLKKLRSIQSALDR
jgi:exopolyphosphatase / guanosine-5'-triphosphate,3'-diphosphate pyrophosphatase